MRYNRGIVKNCISIKSNNTGSGAEPSCWKPRRFGATAIFTTFSL